MSVKTCFVASTSLVALAAFIPAPALAYQEPAITPVAATEFAAADGEEAIIVTGSRLARDPNLTSPSPVTTVTADDVRSTGVTDVTEVLREIPALISSGTVEDSIERGAGGVGQATLNLRGLGANRTLVLVNGRRHVSGVAGTQTVDIATIPRALIESVDILTGGASAVYGSDAVTGVVNFNLRRDFEGIEVNGQAGVSDYGDARTVSVDAVWGRNYLDGRLNVVAAASFTNADEVQFGDRPFSRDNNQASAGLTYQNPDRRFQRGEITQSGTPNFFQRFNIAAGRYPYGFAIPTQAQFASFFPGVTPSAQELALMQRAASAPANVLGRQPVFAISSASGQIARADFDYFGLDVDGNGVEDCFDSYIGFAFAQCYVTTPEGGIRPFRDGLVSTSTNQLGGDGIAESFDFMSLIPKSTRWDLNFLAHFELSTAARFFTELKYVRTESFARPSAPNGFFDLLYISPDNPYIPSVLLPEAIDAGGLYMSRDFADIPVQSSADRDTYRAVFGVEGDVAPNLAYQVYLNYGRTDSRVRERSLLPDRLFAAIDVRQGPNGPTCASTLDPTDIHPGSEFFPVIGPGFFTFTPGANSGCVPINLFSGPNAVTPEALDFITAITENRSRLEQVVLAGSVTGDTGPFFNLPGGPVQFAAGMEFRYERSRSRFDPLELGLLPDGSPAGPTGGFVGNYDPLAPDTNNDGIPDPRQSLVFDGQTRTLNTGGSFDVWEVFGEIRLPIVADRPFAHELSIDGAARYSTYSTVRGAFTWSVSGVYAPVRDIRFRGTYSVAIRAPNIAELFSPQQGATFRPIDPCDINQINTLLGSSNAETVAAGQRRLANCTAQGGQLVLDDAGVYDYTDPLTARFSGTTGGNPDLKEETAKTWTVGGVVQPRFIPGLSITADYYNIEIEDAIAAVSAQNIVNSCYEAETFPNQYCDLFDRGPNFGFTFLRQTQLNFGRLETAGIDASIAYAFGIGEHRFTLRATGNWTEKLDSFFDPTNPNVVDPELGELGFPEWSGVGSVNWSFRNVSIGYRLQYIDEQALAGVEIERQDVEFGPAGTGPDYFVHDISFGLEVGPHFSFYGGINNLTDEEPFANRVSYPVSPIGRFFFLGARARF